MAFSLSKWLYPNFPFYKDRYRSGAYGGRSGLITKLCPILATLWIVACQDALSMGFSRQQFWNGLPFSSSGDLPDPGVELESRSLQAESLPSDTPGRPKYKLQRGKMFLPSFELGTFLV